MELAISKVTNLINQHEKVLLGNIENGLDPVLETAIDQETLLVKQDTEPLDRSIISTDETMVALDNTYKNILKHKQMANLDLETMKLVKQKLNNNTLELENMVSFYKSEYKKRLDKFLKDPIDFENDDSYRSFREAVFNVRHPNQTFSFGNDQSDDELQMVGQSESTLCPITVAQIN